MFGALNHRAGKRGWELWPHRPFWSELAALVQDGVHFSRAAVLIAVLGERPRAQGDRTYSSQSVLPLSLSPSSVSLSLFVSMRFCACQIMYNNEI